MRIVILGAGGHAGVVIAAIKRGKSFDIGGVLDEHYAVGTMRHGYPVGDPKKDWSRLFAHAAIGDNAIREKLSGSNFNFVNVIHPTATHANLECVGTFLAANSVVGNNSFVGNFCIINTGAILEHDSSIGDYSHLCPGVITGGRVKIGSRTTIGLGAMIRDGITIGDDCVVGMGAVVTKNVPDGTTVFGNPARVQK
jgi:sugar O-acyltransferase (sialic acid O-acetyltransferase NeuD family)